MSTPSKSTTLSPHNAGLAFDSLTAAERALSTAIHYLGAGNPASGLLVSMMQDLRIPQDALAAFLIENDVKVSA